jgi:hypothetical protein
MISPSTTPYSQFPPQSHYPPFLRNHLPPVSLLKLTKRSHDPSSPKKWGHLTLKPPTIDDYIGTPVEHSKRMIIWLTDRQPTHPQKVGAMIWEVALSSLFILVSPRDARFPSSVRVPLSCSCPRFMLVSSLHARVLFMPFHFLLAFFLLDAIDGSWDIVGVPPYGWCWGVMRWTR